MAITASLWLLAKRCMTESSSQGLVIQAHQPGLSIWGRYQREYQGINAIQLPLIPSYRYLKSL